MENPTSPGHEKRSKTYFDFFRLRRLPPSRKKVKGFCFHWVQKVLGVAMIVGLAVVLAVAGVVSLFFSMKSNSKVENAKS